jgi:8-oxo-dGTP diphosphatase
MDQGIIITVDVVLFTLGDDGLQVVLPRREKEPYHGQPALPGGYIHAEEDMDSPAAARRVLKDKTGLISPYLEQLYTFSGGARDPRGWSVSIAYYALVSADVLTPEGPAKFTLFLVDDLPQLPFDHNLIIGFAADRLRNKSTYSALPCYLLPKTFTLTELQRTYEKVLGHKLDKSAFRRKISELDFLEPVDEVRTGVHRPARLFRIRPTKTLVLFDRTI